MRLHSLLRTSEREKQRVGRGQSSGRGKTSGRGTKGQNARSGHKKRPEWRDIIKKLPKRRGYGKNRGRTVVASRLRPTVIQLSAIESHFASEEVNPKSLIAHNLLVHRGAAGPVKVVGAGTISKKLSLKGISVSANVRAAIEKAGGTVA